MTAVSSIRLCWVLPGKAEKTVCSVSLTWYDYIVEEIRKTYNRGNLSAMFDPVS